MILRIVTTFDAKKEFDIGRQTNFVNLDDLKPGEKLSIKPKGKKLKNITIERLSDEEVKSFAKENVK